ncbi:MAG: hypothetical protein C0490_03445 [Marivirga sp.]|nr:hypothetical protein [Marivirga sp.]
MLFFGCSQDRDFKPAYDVPEEFQLYFDTFINEAASRGFNYKITNLIVKYDEAVISPSCGQCNSNSMDASVQKVITINPNLQCWFTDEEKEAFFIHELGHCVLGRLHDNTLLPNGDPKSMMAESRLDVYSVCIYQIDEQECDRRYKRPYYIDELFDENTSVPEWGK